MIRIFNLNERPPREPTAGIIILRYKRSIEIWIKYTNPDYSEANDLEGYLTVKSLKRIFRSRYWLWLRNIWRAVEWESIHLGGHWYQSRHARHRLHQGGARWRIDPGRYRSRLEGKARSLRWCHLHLHYPVAVCGQQKVLQPI